jgi:phospholipase/lecithinase/hemolysin
VKKSIRQLLLPGAFLLALLLPLRATAATYSKIYVFGDSLSDTGNAFNATRALRGTGSPAPPYADGRFSNGSLWVDYLAQDLGLAPVPYTQVVTENAASNEGINFAFGGATTRTAPAGAPPDLQQQVRFFTSLMPAGETADPNALYLIWIGSNDYLQGIASDADRPLENLSAAINTLIQSGARQILVVNLPNLGLLPATRNTAETATLDRLSADYNTQLAALIQDLNQSIGSPLTIAMLDAEALFRQARQGELGFANATDACFNPDTGAICANPAGYLFWDGIHPTTAAHDRLATAALELLQSPNAPATSSIPQPWLGLGAVAASLGGIGLVAKLSSNSDRARR